MAAAAAAPLTQPDYSGYTKEGLARIISQDSVQNEDGSYQWKYDTENGISASEVNVPHPAGPDGSLAPSVQGGYAYTAPDGQPISITYTAGEQGFVAQGASIPVPPPIPEEILRSLEWNAAHPEEEAQWDPENVKSQYYQRP